MGALAERVVVDHAVKVRIQPATKEGPNDEREDGHEPVLRDCHGRSDSAEGEEMR